MDQMSVSDWKEFLNARISQENGEDDKALEVFENLLSKHPSHPHLLASRSFALSRTGRGQEALASMVAARYSVLGKNLVGDNDTPDDWTHQLKGLLDNIDQSDGENLSATLIAW